MTTMNVPIIGTGMNMPSSESRCKNENKKKEPGKMQNREEKKKKID